MFNLVLGTVFVFGTLMAFSFRTTTITMSPLLEIATAPNAAQIYTMKCAKCHNADPEKKGPIGPEIANSSFDLLKTKTQFRMYPPGYKPKRSTKIMPRIPLSDDQIRSLEAFLKRTK